MKGKTQVIKIAQRRTEIINISLTADEAKEVITQYIEKEMIGEGCYITREGRLEHWTSFPHGSGTTTDHGEPTPLQKASWGFLKLLKES